MNFIIAIVAFVVISTADGAALPVDYPDDLSVDNSDDIDTIVDDDRIEPSIRQRRLTCDLFSFKSKWVTPNSSACAARCIATFHKGGWCNNGVCVCRRKVFG